MDSFLNGGSPDKSNILDFYTDKIFSNYEISHNYPFFHHSKEVNLGFQRLFEWMFLA